MRDQRLGKVEQTNLKQRAAPWTEQGRSIFGGVVSAAAINKSGHKNPTSRADNAITVMKENVTHKVACEHVRQVLTTFTWPACLS